MTPEESYAAIEAATWREENRLKQQVTMARLTAGLIRAKRLPSTGALLARASRPQKLSGRKLQRRRQEFRQAASAENINRINKHVKKRVANSG